MSQNSDIIMKGLDNSNSLYRELEINNFKEQVSKKLYTQNSRSNISKHSVFKKNNVQDYFFNKGDITKKICDKKLMNQFILFQKSMKVLMICGQIIGVIPVIGVSELDILKIRFKHLSFRFAFSFLIFLCQAVVTALCIYRLLRNSISITVVSFVSFYFSTAMTTLLFLRVAAKWPALMRDILNSSLDKYLNVEIKAHLLGRSTFLLTLALLEHFLSTNTKLTQALLCPRENGTLYQEFIELSFPWYAELGLPFYIPTGIFLQFLNITTTINWSYSDIFLVCMSYYLAEIINQINKTIVEAKHKYYPPSYWCILREDYTRATNLVYSFDKAIGGIMFCSFASNLFFICLQLFHIFSHGVKAGNLTNCPNQNEGIFRGYENMIYFIFSFAFVLARFLTVSLRASSIHTSSLEVAPALYNIPSTIYCSEIQRFIEQAHGTTVALTGMQFFYVTRGLILSVAGTIVTYELVLLQFNGESK